MLAGVAHRVLISYHRSIGAPPGFANRNELILTPETYVHS